MVCPVRVTHPDDPPNQQRICLARSLTLRSHERIHVVAGAVASRSERVVGVCNVFASAGRADVAWPGVLQSVGRLCQGLQVVGYERGEDLASAITHGFRPIDPLRVWRHR